MSGRALEVVGKKKKRALLQSQGKGKWNVGENLQRKERSWEVPGERDS